MKIPLTNIIKLLDMIQKILLVTTIKEMHLKLLKIIKIQWNNII